MLEKRRSSPCDLCRARHIRCGNDDPCDNCRKTGRECRRSRPFEFKIVARQKSGMDFSVDQPWFGLKREKKLAYIDMTKKVTRAAQRSVVERKRSQSPLTVSSSTLRSPTSSQDGPSTVSTTDTADNGCPPALGSDESDSISSDLTTQITRKSTSSEKERQLVECQTSLSVVQLHQQEEPPQAYMTPESSHNNSIAGWIDDSLDASSTYSHTIESQSRTSNFTYPLSQSWERSDLSHALTESMMDKASLELQEACLLRYFAEHLAQWFDTSDQDRHFALVVPARAMFCPALLYAIYTASARHLTRLSHERKSNETVEFRGVPLPNLNEATAIRYHNICISYLITISNDPSQSYNEDTLTAATILRFHEQIDTPSSGFDSQTYLNVVQAVINTQRDPSFYSVATIQGPGRDDDIYASPACSLRHSACLLALQQEIWSIMLVQRPCRLPLCPKNDYSVETLTPTDDFGWTKRIFVWTADVLKHCFGDENSMTKKVSIQTCIAQWDNLKKFEETWELLRPPSFKPCYYRGADHDKNRFFPDVWYTNECQVVGLQHIEISKVLLAVHDPRLPRLGPQVRSSARRIKEQLRESTLYICGLALSKPSCPAAMVTAAIGVSLCGESLSDPHEQDATVQFLIQVEEMHAWPTQDIVYTLRQSWAT